MSWVEEELDPPGRIHWLLGVLDHDLTNNDLAMAAAELAGRYVEDVRWLLGELDAYRAAFAELAQLARDANATLAAVRTVAARAAKAPIGSDDPDPVPASPSEEGGRR